MSDQLNDQHVAPPRHAVVTGASSGIGRAIAERLLADGWRVSGLDAAPATLVHPALTSVQVDLADDAVLCDALVALPAPHALIHAAGVLRIGTLAQLDAADGALMWRIHVDAATRLTQAFAPAMREQGGGRIVFIGSRVAQGMPGRGLYAASKAALVALARSWAAELIADGVTVNVISPAATQTRMLTDPSRAASAPRTPPLGRLIQPAEIAALAAFLLSVDAAPITGQDIAICGGASLPGAY